MTEEEADGEAMLEQGLRMKLERLVGDKKMNEISEAAKRLAREKLTAEYGIRPAGSWPHDAQSAAEYTLARVLQEHSDVAKEFRAVVGNGLISSDRRGAACEALQSLILPDEPLDDLTVVEGYQLQPDGTRTRVRVALRDMRIVEDKGDD